ncbi:MAG: class I SAM-dependent methyltransferase [Anaerolineales bacterium]|nr:class I SAM-dependent methyltransferase [Anaerolineales bacterium]
MKTQRENGNPLSSAEPWNLVADGYTTELKYWSELIAGKALELANLPSSPHIVDIAAGPGSLSLLAAKAGAVVSAIDFSENMVTNLLRSSKEMGLTLADVRVGDGQNLPYDDCQFDGAFSMVGLIFFPDRGAGFREMCRVLRPGCRAVVSSIASIEGPFVQVLEVMSEIVPAMPNTSNNKPPLSNSNDFSQEMSDGGFRDVTIHTVTEVFTTPTLADFWWKTQRSAAPVALIKSSLGEEQWDEVSTEVIRHLQETFSKGSVEEVFTMHLGVGVR